MKTYWSTIPFFALLLLGACGKEEFGTPAKKEANPVVANERLEQRSCSNLTLINPKVDILYVVDNSTSSNFIHSGVKEAIRNTINSISNDFDYRIIGTTLLPTSQGTEGFEVLAKNPQDLPANFSNKKVTHYSQFSFFSQQSIITGSQEPGLATIRDFMTAHLTDGLLRPDAYHFIVVISNGRDTDVEKLRYGSTQETEYVQDPDYGTVLNRRFQEFKQLKASLNSTQFRLFSLTASTIGNSNCPSGHFTSNKSYVEMSRMLYQDHSTPALTDQNTRLVPFIPDHYNLCGSSVAGVFQSVNNSIKKIVLPHTYRYWPVTMNAVTGVDISTMKVFKVTDSGTVQLPRGSAWEVIDNPGNVDTRILPTPGEPTTTPKVIEFRNGNDIVYPDCITITSDSNLEIFKSIVLTRPAITNDPGNPIVVKINGVAIPPSAYSYRGQVFEENIKVQHTINGVTYEATPEQKRSGYFITITDPAYYYKSGDSVEVGYKPAPI